MIQAQCNDTLFGIFNRIGDQIVQNDGHHFLVKVQGHILLFQFDVELYIRFAVQFLIFEADFMHQISDIVMSHTEFLILRFRLSEFQYLIYQVQQPDGTLMNHRYLLGIFV